jgi:hypothetical protein
MILFFLFFIFFFTVIFLLKSVHLLVEFVYLLIWFIVIEKLIFLWNHIIWYFFCHVIQIEIVCHSVIKTVIKSDFFRPF